MLQRSDRLTRHFVAAAGCCWFELEVEQTRQEKKLIKRGITIMIIQWIWNAKDRLRPSSSRGGTADWQAPTPRGRMEMERR